MKKMVIFLVLLTSCQSVPRDLMQPCAETMKIREAQSRTFCAKSDKDLMRASVAVLQDMGYTIAESSSDYGVLTASKQSSAVSAGQVALSIGVAMLGGQPIPYDKTQYITVTMVVLDKAEEERAQARTTFQRVIERTDNTRYAEVVTDQGVYTDFYDKLNKALFLEVNNV